VGRTRQEAGTPDPEHPMEPAIDRQAQPAMLSRGWAVTRWCGLVLACGAGIAAAISVLIVTVQTLVGT
jgi:hypothetical protein